MTYLQRITTATLLAGITAVFASLVGFAGTPNAHAATPPDSCFAFNAGTGTITDYYDHEGNNSANPACPRDVDIPSTIGGVPVTTIGNATYPGAFTSKSLTSVTIPSSVTSIGNYAFYTTTSPASPSPAASPVLATPRSPTTNSPASPSSMLPQPCSTLAL